ncbi:MAG: manganese efflux pump MntP family protein [Chloroflexota bacterium]
MIAIGMAMDASAVSLCVGGSPHLRSLRARLRLAFHFGWFQFMMPIIGWLGGSLVSHWVSAFDHWIAAGLLGYVGGKMIREGLQGEGDDCQREDPTRGKTLVMLAIATSIDALAVGLSLAMLGVEVLTPALTIGLVTFGLSMLALLASGRLGARFGQRMEVVGGLVLIGIGVRILVEHLL